MTPSPAVSVQLEALNQSLSSSGVVCAPPEAFVSTSVRGPVSSRRLMVFKIALWGGFKGFNFPD